MEPYRLKGVLPGHERADAAAVSTHRKQGLSRYVTVDGQAYMGPGLGVTTASTPTRLSLVAVRVRQYLRQLARLALDPFGQFQNAVKEAGITAPRFHISITPRGVGLYEEESKTAWSFPVKKEGENAIFLHELRELICPDWAMKALVKAGRLPQS